MTAPGRDRGTLGGVGARRGDRVVPEGGLISRKLGFRAQELGHDVRVVHRAGVQRFTLACSCGFATQANWTRKRTFSTVVEHLTEVVRLGVSLGETVAAQVEDAHNAAASGERSDRSVKPVARGA